MFSTITLQNFSLTKLLRVAKHFAHQPGTCLLYSGGCLDVAQNSYLGLFPFETLTIQHPQVCYLKQGVESTYTVSNPWEGLKIFFSGEKNNCDYAFGFLGYEMGAFSDETKQLPYQRAETPDAYWQRCAIVIDFNHRTQAASIIIREQDLSFIKWLEHFLTQPCINKSSGPLEPLIAREKSFRNQEYLSKIEIIKEYIRSGDVYQVNFSQQFLFQGKRDPFDVFYKMVYLNPAPFSAYFCLKDFYIVSTSPERFLRKIGEKLETRPIKGTIKRGQTFKEDQELQNSLLASPKERAELLMITDLLRNDLGKISQVGTVDTKEIWRCEAYTNVFHLLSIIQSRALSNLSTLDLIRYCFPGGSITGCPKLRAMEVIHELEQRPRGLYTGSIGYIKGNQDFDLNIAIRTLVFSHNLIDLQLGGGIVIDSNPEQEYQETLIKGASLFKVLKGE